MNTISLIALLVLGVSFQAAASDHRINKRVNHLEREVKHLKIKVDYLENEQGHNDQHRSKFICSFRSCRQSTSPHNANKSNCDLFRLWRIEKQAIRAVSLFEAKGILQSKIKHSRDIKIYDSKFLRCWKSAGDYARN